MTSLRRLLLGLGVLGLVAGAVPLALALTTEGGHHRNLIAIFGPLIGWAFIGTGLVACWRRVENPVGALMTAVGFSYCISALIVSTEPVLFTIGLLFIPLPYAILYHILLAFPTGRLNTTVERWLVGVGYVSATVGHATAMLFQDTARVAPGTSTAPALPENVFFVFHQPTVVRDLYRARFIVGLILILWLGALLVQRWRTAPTLQRRGMVPVFISGGVVMGLFAIWYAANLADLSQYTQDVLERARVVALAGVPFAFLGGLLRSRVAQAGAVSTLVTQLSLNGQRRGLRDVLADTLGDPSLGLAYWLPDRGVYVDADGHEVQVPPPGSGRICTPIENNGRRIAALFHDASLAHEQDMIRTVGAAAALALENERLDAELRAKVEELRASRARIVESGDAARRRIERDLHDGAQQRLVSLALTLRLARTRLDNAPDAARELLESAGRELEVALAELRELARGIHPAVLSERGLNDALHALTHRANVPVELIEVPAERLPKPLEAAAYFVVAEAITNVAKYAQASRASVAVRRDNGLVTVEVVDDGVGGADPTKGSGLRGLADRVSALDGRLEVLSKEGVGTTIRAVIPCG